MATRTVVCPECDAPLSPGRFACAACGALVAAVATDSRSFIDIEPVVAAIPATLPAVEAAPEPPPAPDPTWPSPDDAPLASAAAFRPEDPVAPAPARKPRIVTPSRRPKATKESAPPADNGHVPAPVAVAVANAVSAVSAPSVEEPPLPTPASTPASPPQAPPATAPQASAPTWPERPVWPPQRSIDDVAPPVEVDETPADRVPAGTYLPPSAVLPPGEALPALRAEAQAEAVAKAKESRSLRLTLGEGTGPFGMSADGPTRVVILGAGIATFGFLLPWAKFVIGSGSRGSYLAEWGLAGPGHLLILALLLGLAAVAFAAERLPSWVRLGLPSIALACVLAGIVWPYLVGPLDASIGVYVVAVGALVMIAGGLLDRIATRHADGDATV